ncbi:MAG: glycosyltransferase [Chloroflexi bacterium]|nr:glycosyltransferase [Chloroflexota bacterium]
MNILFLALYPPLPAIDGGRLRIFNVLQQAAQRHRVTLVALDDPLCDAVNRAALAALCEVVTVPRPPALARTWVTRIRDIASSEPVGLNAWQSDAMHALVRRLAAEERYDLAHIDHLSLMPYAGDLGAMPVVLTHHNVEALAQRRQLAISGRSVLRRWLDAREHERWRRYEIAASKRADALIAVSETDAAYFRAALPGKPVFVVPNGVDTAHLQPRQRAAGARLLYTGSMNYAPNVDAVCWFCEEIFPAIRRARPDAEFVIAGRDPTTEVKALATIDGVRVTGRVDDMRPYYADAAVFVVPLRAGSGTRLKILEAMAMGLPVVTTTIGCEGLDVSHDRDLLIADTPGAFATAVNAALADPDVCARLGTHARQTVLQNYSMQAIDARLSETYQSIAHTDPPRENESTR